MLTQMLCRAITGRSLLTTFGCRLVVLSLSVVDLKQHPGSFTPMQGMLNYPVRGMMPPFSSSFPSSAISTSPYGTSPGMAPHSMPTSLSSMSTPLSMSSVPLFAMLAMLVPLSQVPPITAFTYPAQAGSNVTMQQGASAQRNLPQHAHANTLTGSHGGASSLSQLGSGRLSSSVVASQPKLEVLIIPISHAPTVKHGLIPDLDIQFFLGCSTGVPVGSRTEPAPAPAKKPDPQTHGFWRVWLQGISQQDLDGSA
ncbi:hypothetical protein C8T65DRAFT_693569 [Cerioporus squamosus]|nr:hypothetical protein C8T65DRAFT_693569 [Cerioporus squamosus]